MYSIFDYGKMIADPVRMGAYAEAIETSVEPGMTVLDLGTGTGIFALLACRAGARMVYAVDPSEAIQVGNEIARANGFEKRIEFIQGRSTEIDLSERVDLIVSDMRGIVPFSGTHLADIIDARSRFLGSNGRLLPLKDMLYGSLAESPDQYRKFVHPWLESPMGFDMSPACRYLLHTWKKTRDESFRAISPPCLWTAIDYETINSTEGTGRLSWTVQNHAVAHGFVLWFETNLTESCGFSNAPGQLESIYGKAFFPFLAPLPIKKGDRVEIELRAEAVGHEYTWRWDTVHLSKTNAKRRLFHQSTFYSAPLSSHSLSKREAGYRPTLKIPGEVDRFILNLIDGGKTLQEIAETTHKKFPGVYPTVRKAFDRVGHISQKYSGGGDAL